MPFKILTKAETDTLGGYSTSMVNVIGFTVAGDQPAIHGLADLTEMPGKPVRCGAIEYVASILGDTEQMHGKKRNAMSTAPKVLHVLLQTNHNAQ